MSDKQLKMVKGYDISGFRTPYTTEDGTPVILRPYFIKELFVIEGPKGILVFHDEGIGQILQDMDDKYNLGLQLDDNKNYFMPAYEGSIYLRELIANSPVREVPMVKTVREFGHRLEYNYNLMLKCIKDIGLDPNDYHAKGSR